MHAALATARPPLLLIDSEEILSEMVYINDVDLLIIRVDSSATDDQYPLS